jgi:outer membrane protein OmpU
MNKLKKVGLTALATTLVASSAYAGEMSVSGSASLNYSGLDSSANVNPWTMGDSVTYAGGGDLDNGMTVNVSYELDGGNYDDYSLKLGLGDGMGTLTFSGASVNAGGVDAVKDIVPNAYTPVYEAANEFSGAVDNGLATTSGRSTAGMWGYAVSAGSLDISLGYNQMPAAAAESEQSIGLTYNDAGVEGLTVVAGRMDDSDTAENDTYGVKYTAGSLTAGLQFTSVDYATSSTADQEAMHYGLSVAVNENLSVSAGRQEVEIDNATNDEVNDGIMASYTMGSITLAGGMNKVSDAGGSNGVDAEVAILNASFAF